MIILEPDFHFFKPAEAQVGDTVEGIFRGVRTNKFKQKEIVVEVNESSLFTFPANKKLCGGLAIDPESFNLLPVPQLGNLTTMGCLIRVTFNGKKLKKENKTKAVETLKPTDYYNDFSIGILETAEALKGGKNVDAPSQPTGLEDNTEYSYLDAPESEDYEVDL